MTHRADVTWPRGRLLPLGCVIVGAALVFSGSAASDSILFVGNSFTHGASSSAEHFNTSEVIDLNGGRVGGVPGIFKEIADETGFNFTVSAETVSGANLDVHYNAKRELLAKRWDHVVLQGYSTLDAQAPGDSGKFVRYAGRLAEVFHSQNSGVDVRLVATWPRADQTYLPSGHWYGQAVERMAMDVRAGCDRALAASHYIRAVIPVGEAWIAAMRSGIALSDPYQPGSAKQINLWAPDNYHASASGYYLSALVIYGSVTGRDPQSIGAADRAASALGIAPSAAQALQHVASQALRAEAERTPPPRAARFAVEPAIQACA